MHGPRRNDSDPNASGQSRSTSCRNQRFTSSVFSFFRLMLYITYYTHIQISVKNFLQLRPPKSPICHRPLQPKALPCGFHPRFLHRELASFCRETLQVERVLLRTLIERATERAFHPSYYLTPTGGAGKKASFATETS